MKKSCRKAVKKPGFESKHPNDFNSSDQYLTWIEEIPEDKFREEALKQFDILVKEIESLTTELEGPGV